MKVSTKFSFLLFLFITTFSIPTNAVVDYKPDTKKKTTIVKKQKKAKKKGLFKRWKERLILKKLKRQQKKKEKNSLTQKSDIALTLGVGAVLLWGVIILSVGDFATVAFLVLAFLSALFGCILSASILRKTKDSKEKFKRERRKAQWGLFFSIIAGLPALFFAAFAIMYLYF